MSIDAAGSAGLDRYALLQEQVARQSAAGQAASAKPKTQPFPVVPQHVPAAGSVAGARNGPAVLPPTKPGVWLAAPSAHDAAVPGQGAGTPAPVQDEPRFIGPVVPRIAQAPNGRPSPAALDRMRSRDDNLEAPEQYIIWGSGDRDYTGYYGGPFKTGDWRATGLEQHFMRSPSMSIHDRSSCSPACFAAPTPAACNEGAASC
jgi:hypothetical protein